MLRLPLYIIIITLSQYATTHNRQSVAGVKVALYSVDQGYFKLFFICAPKKQQSKNQKPKTKNQKPKTKNTKQQTTQYYYIHITYYDKYNHITLYMCVTYKVRMRLEQSPLSDAHVWKCTKLSA
jgi:pyruvate/2-oxoacid:ferredoxin oxidoreductase beta subunit